MSSFPDRFVRPALTAALSAALVDGWVAILSGVDSPAFLLGGVVLFGGTLFVATLVAILVPPPAAVRSREATAEAWRAALATTLGTGSIAWQLLGGPRRKREALVEVEA